MSGEKIYGNVLNKRFGQKYDPEQKYIICIQGSSTSGKSTLANTIYNILQKSKIACFTINLDNYYKSSSLPPEETKRELLENKRCYDFDNPAALDWDKIRNLLLQLHNDEEILDCYKYDYPTEICDGPFKTHNMKPSVVIIEGIYAFNCLSPMIFNVQDFDPCNSEKNIDSMFVKNDNEFGLFKVLNIRLTMCKSKSLAIRKERDVNLRGKKEEVCNMQFNTQTWPASEKWVNNLQFDDDVRILHGSFNTNEIHNLVYAISNFFCKKQPGQFEIMVENDTTKQFMVPCSGECNLVREIDH